MKRGFALVLVLFALGFVPRARAADIGIMTQNQYLGIDLSPLFQATSPGDFNEAPMPGSYAPGTVRASPAAS